MSMNENTIEFGTTSAQGDGSRDGDDRDSVTRQNVARDDGGAARVRAIDRANARESERVRVRARKRSRSRGRSTVRERADEVEVVANDARERERERYVGDDHVFSVATWDV